MVFIEILMNYIHFREESILANFKVKQYLKISMVILAILVVIACIVFIMFKYEIEGEDQDKLPFLIEKISVVSTADGIKNKGDSEYLWSGELVQVNDVYIKMSKNTDLSGTIEKILIQNIQITEPQKGEVSLGKIIKSEDSSNDYIIEDINSYEISGGESTSYEKLTIANQGGIVGLRILNRGLGNYSSNDEEINYDGRILNLSNLSFEELKFVLKFDVLIEIKNGIKYKTNVELELPAGNILESGIEINEYINVDNLVYKRY